MQNKLIIFSAPSGSGKTTIVRQVLKKGFKLEFSISACSRKPREKEIDGRDYYFLSVDEFKKRIANDEFLEWEEVYKDNFYGTLKSEIQRIANNSKHVIFDVDVIGGLNIKKQFGNRALSIFVLPPSIEELENRLILRATDDEASIKRRVEKAKHEMEFSEKFDIIIVNDNLQDAVKETINKIIDFLK